MDNYRSELEVKKTSETKTKQHHGIISKFYCV